jgi:nitrate reductase alpha subunit
MKNLLPLLLLFLPLLATAQKLPQDAISTYFSEYVDDQDFTVVYVSGKVFGLFKDANLDLSDLDEKEVEAVFDVVQDIQGIRVLHTEHNAMARWKEAKKRISTDKYELLFKVRTADGDNVEAFVQDEDAVISELFLLIGAQDNFAMLSFIGAVDLSKLADLQRAIEDN